MDSLISDRHNLEGQGQRDGRTSQASRREASAEWSTSQRVGLLHVSYYPNPPEASDNPVARGLPSTSPLYRLPNYLLGLDPDRHYRDVMLHVTFDSG